MWNAKKSVTLSLVCNRLVIAAVIAVAVGTPWLVNGYVYYLEKRQSVAQPLMVTLIASCAVALVALLCLDRLLVNIRESQVFIPENVALLRRISWCCFGVAVILLVSYYYLFFLIAGIAAAFIGLILRVVKNVIEEAIILKNENDLTI
ncbi:DUF2975 domain-containing protein [Bacilliculturomica massiliensis]|uniref:DUF2975 domain-containing protein n=1 Tax=Bacilliculturomica massiliensis TaxID=1917867 RepID=UPI001031CEA7|nr:DUF2975 domain-containing protein [Bacilliculturomica massiliensis]